MPATTQSEIDTLYSQVHRRLVDSGEWDRISLSLKYKLNDEGWIDQLRGKSKEQARVMEPLSLRQLLELVEPSAQASVPETVKHQTLVLIRQFLEKQFDN
ncbi:hypothetical protein HETIRDRAFT_53245 [Heterobasidion irregulare TC 32-1]|uniref:Transcription and mRNA export factor SUS1 n=1 Tax=Heterobasidion irregulare (strain TC 32-1) TaxID=747525 RepID=W4JSE2_HETIT|nr:uncharacterized protein HETIRDRAFT_53245 [Heterobasidion irregulare TC 32-1]ETW76463.1 hypothetical protein HETIRDRAFT_53245 [Heterobasidion irregulare TC 32-1]